MIAPPSFRFQGNIQQSKQYKSIGTKLYNSCVNLAKVEKVNFKSISKVLDDGVKLFATVQKQSNYDNWSGVVNISTALNKAEERIAVSGLMYYDLSGTPNLAQCKQLFWNPNFLKFGLRVPSFATEDWPNTYKKVKLFSESFIHTGFGLPKRVKVPIPTIHQYFLYHKLGLVVFLSSPQYPTFFTHLGRGSDNNANNRRLITSSKFSGNNERFLNLLTYFVKEDADISNTTSAIYYVMYRDKVYFLTFKPVLLNNIPTVWTVLKNYESSLLLKDQPWSFSTLSYQINVTTSLSNFTSFTFQLYCQRYRQPIEGNSLVPVSTEFLVYNETFTPLLSSPNESYDYQIINTNYKNRVYILVMLFDFMNNSREKLYKADFDQNTGLSAVTLISDALVDQLVTETTLQYMNIDENLYKITRLKVDIGNPGGLALVHKLYKHNAETHTDTLLLTFPGYTSLIDLPETGLSSVGGDPSRINGAVLFVDDSIELIIYFFRPSTSPVDLADRLSRIKIYSEGVEYDLSSLELEDFPIPEDALSLNDSDSDVTFGAQVAWDDVQIIVAVGKLTIFVPRNYKNSTNVLTDIKIYGYRIDSRWVRNIPISVPPDLGGSPMDVALQLPITLGKYVK